jgi:FkbM family methyltransferase
MHKLARRMKVKSHLYFSKVYVEIFSSHALQNINSNLLKLALKAKGFNNYSSNLNLSGELACVKRIAKLGIDQVFDVGANTGQYSKVFLEYTSAKVFAFEPMIDSYNQLRLLQESDARLTAFNFALGSSESTRLIYFGSDKDELATLNDEALNVPYVQKNAQKKRDVFVRTLDNVFMELRSKSNLKSLDCIKIDTEGYELEVLKGASYVLNNFQPKVILIEWNWHQLFSNCSIWTIHKMLPDYRVFRILPRRKGLYPVDPKRPEENLAHYSNYVFVRSDLVENFLQD